MASRRRIKDVADLKWLAARKKGCECFIMLNFGLRSSKYIEWDGKKFSIDNEIDDTHQRLTEKQLWTHSNIGPALDKGALILYEWSA